MTNEKEESEPECIEDVIDEHATQITERVFVNGMYQALKQLNSGIEELAQQRTQIAKVLEEIQQYESMGFKIAYYMKNGAYLYMKKEPTKIGFDYKPQVKQNEVKDK